MRITSRGTLYNARAVPSTARFATFPSLERLPSGRLLAAFRVGSSKDSSNEDMRVVASDNEGVTWHTIFGGFSETVCFQTSNRAGTGIVSFHIPAFLA